MYSTIKAISLSNKNTTLAIRERVAFDEGAGRKFMRRLVNLAALPKLGKLLFLLLAVVLINQAWAKADIKTGKGAVAFSTVTVSKSSLSLNAKVGFPSDAGALTVTISGVSATAQTFIKVPEPYHMLVGSAEGETFIITGSSVLTFFVQFTGSSFAGSFPGKLTITGNEITSQSVSLTTTVLAEPIFPVSSLFFTTLEGVTSGLQELDITLLGVSATAQTTIQVAAPFSIFASTTGPASKTLTAIGSGKLILFVGVDKSSNTGLFTGKLTVTNPQAITKTLPLTVEVLPNPSFSPKSLFFSTVLGDTPPLQQVAMTISNVSSGAQTQIQAPASYSLFTSLTGSPAGRLTFTGNGTFKFFVRFNASRDPGTFSEVLTISNPETSTKTFPLKTTVLAVPTPVTNPSTLSGFTAVEGTGTLSAVQSFDLSISGLPSQGTPTVNITAPQGYLVSLSGIVGSFLNSFILTASNGLIKSKVFIALSSSNPVGPVTGNVSITGTQINTKTVAVSGIITAKPQPTLTLDKTSLLGFTTITNKASAAQFYNLKATNLATGVSAAVIAPTGFEVSLSNTNTSIFSSQLTLASSAGSINATVFVRLKSQSVTGTKTGTIQNSVAGLSKTVSLSGTVNAAPTLSVTPISITGFSTVKNQASASKTYTLLATNLATGATATVVPPANYEVRLQNTGSFASSLTLTQSSTGTINRVVEVRLKAITITGTITGTIQNSVAGITKTISLSGTVAAPVLLLSSTSLTGFSAILNQPSSTKSYTFSASNLATGINATITAPAGYEVSLQGTTIFSASLTLTQTASGAISTTILVRLKAQSTTGIKSGNLTNTVAGISKTVAVSGTVQTAAIATSALLDAGNEEAVGSMKAFPNPFGDQLTVEFKEPINQLIHLRLLDLQGNEVFRQEVVSTGGVQQVKVPVNEPRKGIYLLEMVRGTSRKTIQVIKD